MNRNLALGGLALGLVIAIAANLTYAIPRGPVTVGIGLIAPLVLPVALYIRTTFTTVGFWQRLSRELATLAVAGPAAAISYVHTYELVLAQNEPWIIALLAPLSSDGLAGMATLALHRMRQPDVKATQPVQKKQRQRQDVQVTPAAAAPKAPKAKAEKLAPIDWTRTNWPKTAKEIELATGVSKGHSFRLRDQVAQEIEAAS